MTKLAEFFQDGNGTFSATRLGFLLWVIGTLVVWIIGSIEKNALLPIDQSVITIIGALMVGKTVQSFSPNDGNSGQTQPAAPESPKQ
ncbi:MAG: hypothetical protein FDX21_00305 [Chlorobium sp.]|nr:MAG: hypothetical protein FDX21_00305 [Chlorobium sp.]